MAKTALQEAGLDPQKKLEEIRTKVLKDFEKHQDFRRAQWDMLNGACQFPYALIELLLGPGGLDTALRLALEFARDGVRDKESGGGEGHLSDARESQSCLTPSAAGPQLPERAGSDQQRNARESQPAFVAPESLPPAGGAGHVLGVGKSDQAASARAPLPKPSTVTRAAVVSLHEWRSTLNKRRFAEVMVNGRPWYMARAEELLASSERDYITGRFKEFMGRVAMKNPRKPVGELLTQDEFDAAVAYAEKGNV